MLGFKLYLIRSSTSDRAKNSLLDGEGLVELPEVTVDLLKLKFSQRTERSRNLSTKIPGG